MITLESSGGYCKTVCWSVAAGLSNVLIGAVNMTAVLYSISTKDPHVALCTLAYQLFSAEAILILNYFNGWSRLMRARHRRLMHVLLQICALVCSISGTLIIFIQGEWTGSLHGITGVTAVALSGLSFLSGPFALFGGRSLNIFHMFIGIPTFLMSSVTLCLAFFMTDFKNWGHSATPSLLTAFVIFYTVYIVIYLLVELFYTLK